MSTEKKKDMGGYPSSRVIEVGDMLHSDTATAKGIDNTPSFEELQNIEKMVDVLNRMYYEVGPFRIDSGYRSYHLNREVGGSPTSLHMNGLAADIIPLPRGTAGEWFLKLLKSSVRSELGEFYLRFKHSPPTGVHISLGGRYGGVTPYRMGGQLKSGAYVQMSEKEIRDRLKGMGIVAGISLLAIFLGGAGALTVWYLKREGIIG